MREAPDGRDAVTCPGVSEPNLCRTALEAFRSESGVTLPPLEVTVEKRIPVAAGLGGGSADAAAVLRAANEAAGAPLGADALRRLARRVGADTPSQIEPRHALVRGAGEIVEPVALPPMALVLVPADEGLSTAEVYREADRLEATRASLDPERVRALAGRPLRDLAAALENDLQAAAVSLRPELSGSIELLERAGAAAALITGSGPTVFGVFESVDQAGEARDGVPGALAVGVR